MLQEHHGSCLKVVDGEQNDMHARPAQPHPGLRCGPHRDLTCMALLALLSPRFRSGSHSTWRAPPFLIPFIRLAGIDGVALRPAAGACVYNLSIRQALPRRP